MLSSRSSRYFLMYGRLIRAVTFQSMVRISSPGSYSRTSSKSRPRPRKTLRYVPTIASSARMRALISTCFTSRRTSGGIRSLWRRSIARVISRDRDVVENASDDGHRPLDGLPVHDHPLLLRRRVTDDDLHHEAVHLRLGQPVGPLVLDGVLRREHGEQFRQRMRLAADGDLTLLHSLEERALHLGRRPVDLVREEQIGEDRAEPRPESLVRRIVD